MLQVLQGGNCPQPYIRHVRAAQCEPLKAITFGDFLESRIGNLGTKYKKRPKFREGGQLSEVGIAKIGGENADAIYWCSALAPIPGDFAPQFSDGSDRLVLSF